MIENMYICAKTWPNRFKTVISSTRACWYEISSFESLMYLKNTHILYDNARSSSFNWQKNENLCLLKYYINICPWDPEYRQEKLQLQILLIITVIYYCSSMKTHILKGTSWNIPLRIMNCSSVISTKLI